MFDKLKARVKALRDEKGRFVKRDKAEAVRVMGQKVGTIDPVTRRFSLAKKAETPEMRFRRLFLNALYGRGVHVFEGVAAGQHRTVKRRHAANKVARKQRRVNRPRDRGSAELTGILALLIVCLSAIVMTSIIADALR